MTEKENKAIDLLKFYEGFFKNIGHEEEVKSIESIINYIEKLQKEAEETQPIIEVLENFGKNGHGEYSKRYFAEYRAIHHTAFYDFIPDPDEIYKKYYEQKKEIEKLKKENEELKNKVVKRDNEIIELEENAEKKFLTKQELKENYIRKDKIRNFIEKHKDNFYDGTANGCDYIDYEVIKEFIEEE